MDGKSFTPIRPNTDAGSANFTLIAMNASTRLRKIDLKIYIDDKLVVRDELENQISDEEMPSISRHRRYDFELTKGRHLLRAVSGVGKAEQREIINMESSHQWAVLGYERDTAFKKAEPERFSFILQGQPVLFQ